jgi:hypothetical protein
VLDNGLSVSAFKAEQMSGVAVGLNVSFAYDTKVVNGKEYNNVKGSVAVVSGGAAPAAAPSAPAAVGQRNGMQVGASINQAIAALPVLGTEPTLDNIEHLAQSFLMMGDRLSTYKG